MCVVSVSAVSHPYSHTHAQTHMHMHAHTDKQTAYTHPTAYTQECTPPHVVSPNRIWRNRLTMGISPLLFDACASFTKRSRVTVIKQYT